MGRTCDRLAAGGSFRAGKVVVIISTITREMVCGKMLIDACTHGREC